MDPIVTKRLLGDQAEQPLRTRREWTFSGNFQITATSTETFAS